MWQHIEITHNTVHKAFESEQSQIGKDLSVKKKIGLVWIYLNLHAISGVHNKITQQYKAPSWNKHEQPD